MSELEQQLEQKDEFASFWARIIRFARQYRVPLYIGLGVLLIAYFGHWGYWQYRDNVEKGAWATYESTLEQVMLAAQESEDKKIDETKAAEALKIIIKNHPGTAAEAQSNLDIASIFARQGSYETAIEHYKLFLGSLSEGNPAAISVYQAIGQCYESLKDYDQAEQFYARLKADTNLIDLSLWNIARVAYLAGDKAKAVNAYKNIINDYPKSAYFSQAHDRLAVIDE